MHFQLPNCPLIGPLVVCFYYQYFNTPFQSMKLRPEFSPLEPFSSNARLEMRPKFNTVSSQPDLNICPRFSSLSLGWTNGIRGSLFLLPTPVYALPNFQLFFNWTKGSLFLLPIPVNAPKYSSVESFSCNVDMKLRPNSLHLNLSRVRLEMRPKFNTVSSQPDLN